MRKILMICGLFAVLGCHQNYEEGAHPPPIPPQTAQVPPNHPPVQNEATPPVSTGEAVISGTISVAEELVGRLPKQAIMYIIARPSPTGGPPLAIQRMSVPSFPFEYALTQTDAGMMPGQEVNLTDLDALYITVKIDQDGKVGPAEPGDMEGTCVSNPVVPGTHDAHVIIDKVY